MTEIIGVRFKLGGKQYYFDPKGIPVSAGDGVILETARGLEYGECIRGNALVEDESIVVPLRPLVRVATNEDLRALERNKEREKKAMLLCQDKVLEHKLDMKLVSVEYNFEGNKALFFFTSENRVDFRALVKDLASLLHARIELRQIGVRDEAKMLGGLGICGKPFCCNQFLEDFQPVSIKMAKTQNLSLNPTKISGTCGRLMCCLKYEQEAYEDAVRRCPKQESFVETPDGVGNVYNVNLLREQVKVRLDNAPETPKIYHNCEICVIRNGKGKRPEDYVAPPLEEMAKRRWVDSDKLADEAAALARHEHERTKLSSALEAVFRDAEAPKRAPVAPPSRPSGPRAPCPPRQAQPQAAAPAEKKPEGGSVNPRSRNRRRHRGPKPPTE